MKVCPKMLRFPNVSVLINKLNSIFNINVSMMFIDGLKFKNGIKLNL